MVMTYKVHPITYRIMRALFTVVYRSPTFWPSVALSLSCAGRGHRRKTRTCSLGLV